MASSVDVIANCAICNLRHQDLESVDTCENRALRTAIENAERKWLDSWISRIDDWVTNKAVQYITTTFADLKERRIRSHQAFVTNLPYYREYRLYHGKPPHLHFSFLLQLRTQLQAAERDLQCGVNEDWKACVMKYPEVLDHYYNKVRVEIPRGPVESPSDAYNVPDPTSSHLTDPVEVKKGRKSGRNTAPPPGSSAFARPPGNPIDDLVSRRNSHKTSKRDSDSYVLSGGGGARSKRDSVYSVPVPAPMAPMPPTAPYYLHGNY